MESLAIVVSGIVFAIIVVGLVAVVTVFRTPRTSFGRTVSLVLNTIGIAAGFWLASIDVGMGARVVGAFVVTANVISAV
ncbi:MAG: hypothetical protein RJA15_369, partial [Actinomycetota bacterium]